MQIVRCGRCGMMYQNPRIAESDMADAYESIAGYHRFAEQDSAKREMFRARIARFRRERSLPAAGSFLDIGASRGVMLDAIREALPDWSVSAVELSPSARRHIVRRGFSAVRSIGELPDDAMFDWINIDNVLEHIPDPLDTLIHLKARLKPGGFLYIEVPNESFLQVRYRLNDFVRGHPKLPTCEGHVNLFTRSTLERLCRAVGFACERVWLESISMPHRLKGAAGGDPSPRTERVFRLLRGTRLDIALRLAYFLCIRLELPRTSKP